MTEPTVTSEGGAAAERGLLPEVRFDGKVTRGRDGWLFLDGDTNEVMRQQRGELLFSDEQLDKWRSLLEARTEWLGQARSCPIGS